MQRILENIIASRVEERGYYPYDKLRRELKKLGYTHKDLREAIERLGYRIERVILQSYFICRNDVDARKLRKTLLFGLDTHLPPKSIEDIESGLYEFIIRGVTGRVGEMEQIRAMRIVDRNGVDFYPLVPLLVKANRSFIIGRLVKLKSASYVHIKIKEYERNNPRAIREYLKSGSVRLLHGVYGFYEGSEVSWLKSYISTLGRVFITSIYIFKTFMEAFRTNKCLITFLNKSLVLLPIK